MNLDLLLNEIEANNENHDFDSISEYEIILGALKRIFGNHETVEEIEKALSGLKKNAEDSGMFNAVKMEMIDITGDEELAEDVAWDLVFK